MKAPTKENFDVLARAGGLAQKFGESFVVFVGGLASYTSVDVGAARHQARENAKRVGRSNVKITKISGVRI
jgi:hypothetical protein